MSCDNQFEACEFAHHGAALLRLAVYLLWVGADLRSVKATPTFANVCELTLHLAKIADRRYMKRLHCDNAKNSCYITSSITGSATLLNIVCIYWLTLRSAGYIGNINVFTCVPLLQKNYQLEAKNIHIIGHSLGAHTAAYAANVVPGLARITGLDPAEPYYQVR